MPRQVSPEYAAEVFTDLQRTRSELCVQKEKVERLARAMRCPLPGLDVAAIACFAEDDKEHIALVQATTTIIRDDVHKCEGVHEKRPSKQH